MWIDNLIELRAKKGNPSFKIISDKSKVPERTVTRIFSRETDNPYIDTVVKIVKYGLEGSTEDVFADTKQVVCNIDVIKLQEDYDVAVAANGVLNAENDMLKTKVSALEAEVELLKMKLQHKEELLAVHNFYMHIKPDSEK